MALRDIDDRLRAFGGDWRLERICLNSTTLSLSCVSL